MDDSLESYLNESRAETAPGKMTAAK
jgi:hypothetical protein